MKNIKHIFREKTSIKAELQKALENKVSINASILAKLVGISVYRVKKYCKTHNIDLNNYDQGNLEKKALKKAKEENTKDKKKKDKKIVIGIPTDIKIKLEQPKDIKVKLD